MQLSDFCHTAQMKSHDVKVKISRPAEIESLRRAGYQVAHPDWGTFMVKPLLPKVTAEDAPAFLA